MGEEQVLKHAIRSRPDDPDDRAEIVEGLVTPASTPWANATTVELIREQLGGRIRELGLVAGSGDLDLPGTENLYVPDLAVVPTELAKTEGALLPSQTILVVEATDGTDRTAKRRRYSQFGAPLYLLVDRQERTCTLLSQPGQLGYTRIEGPHPFGTPVRLPAPLDLELNTAGF